MAAPEIEIHVDAAPWVVARGDRKHLLLWASASLPSDDPDYAPVAAFIAEHGLVLAAWRQLPPGEIPILSGLVVRAWFMAPDLAKSWAAGEESDIEQMFTALDYMQPE